MKATIKFGLRSIIEISVMTASYNESLIEEATKIIKLVMNKDVKFDEPIKTTSYGNKITRVPGRILELNRYITPEEQMALIEHFKSAGFSYKDIS